MLYMVVERFTQGPGPVYRRAAEQGRLLPNGLEYVDSWVDERLDRCFQLTQTHDSKLLDDWTKRSNTAAQGGGLPLLSTPNL